MSDFLFLGGAAAVAAFFGFFGVLAFRERGDDVEVLVYSLGYFAIALVTSFVAVGGVVLWLREWLRSPSMKP